MAEGAAVVVLESASLAEKRGARVYAQLAGAATSSDAYDVAPPDPSGQGQLRAMQQALAQAGDVSRSIVHVNAHATATPVGDTIEAKAINQALTRILGPAAAADVTLSATKSMTGHLLGAAGALESIFTILALNDRVAPPTTNIEELDPAVPGRIVRDVPQPLGSGKLAGMNNAFGFGGHNVALVFTTV
jgi:3-oxoacyl-[acyl-carrier-protein] synthase II